MFNDDGIKIGSRATMCVGSDDYAVTVVGATAKTVTVRKPNGDTMVFRRNAGGAYVNSTRFLDFSRSETWMDPSF